MNSAAGVISGSSDLSIDQTVNAIVDKLEDMYVAELIVLLLEIILVYLGMKVMALLITVILYGRMIEIYCTCSIAPIPFATLTNKEWGNIGNYSVNILP